MPDTAVDSPAINHDSTSARSSNESRSSSSSSNSSKSSKSSKHSEHDPSKNKLPPLPLSDEPENLSKSSRRGRTNRSPSVSSRGSQNRRSHSQTRRVRSTSEPRRGRRPDHLGETRRTRGSRGSLSSTRRSRDNPGHNFVDPFDPSFDTLVSKYQRAPGPQYDLDKSSKYAMRHSFNATMGTETRLKENRYHTPGAGPAFNFDPTKSSRHPSSPKATIGRAPLTSSIIRSTPVSGPLPYLPSPDIYKRRSPRGVIGTEDRDKHFVTRTLSQGPGSYETHQETKHTSKKGTFTKNERNTISWVFK
ncbi:hypothetical protein BLNAU_6971 [Blattamonas nauphoetae]|uniref:Uncharacterized protein n=1 Tax=Blattamonas nauphoetae TaxID=2049346 RepID=A0ABQ9Y2T1_9EUKA|nr:hypothetical protein BLNAU_6971 [Blattamonas nauphoetae]